MPSKTFRVLILLIILALVAVWLAADTDPPAPDWMRPLKVAIYPHNADGSESVAAWIDQLSPEYFAPIEQYMAEQARPYTVPIDRPFHFALREPLDKVPPPPPESTAFFHAIRWGLAVRWWQWRHRDRFNDPDIAIIARYYSADEAPRLMHSVGFTTIRLAMPRLIADSSDSGHGHFILAHEILHTVGASDLYDPATGLPIFPEGYAEPDHRPRFPQRRAELMAGQIPLSSNRARQVSSLDQTVIGRHTAEEIGWIKMR